MGSREPAEFGRRVPAAPPAVPEAQGEADAPAAVPPSARCNCRGFVNSENFIVHESTRPVSVEECEHGASNSNNCVHCLRRAAASFNDRNARLSSRLAELTGVVPTVRGRIFTAMAALTAGDTTEATAILRFTIGSLDAALRSPTEEPK